MIRALLLAALLFAPVPASARMPVPDVVMPLSDVVLARGPQRMACAQQARARGMIPRTTERGAFMRACMAPARDACRARVFPTTPRGPERRAAMRACMQGA